MARTALELNAYRAATLLRCQQARETRQRLLSLRADHAAAAALTTEQAARDSLHSYTVASRGELAALYDRLPGHVIDNQQLQELAAQERQIAREAQKRRNRLILVQTETQKAQETAARARAEFAKQMRATARRTRLAELVTRRWQDMGARMEDQERDDQVADHWYRHGR